MQRITAILFGAAALSIAAAGSGLAQKGSGSKTAAPKASAPKSSSPKTTGPKATYEMDAETMSGLGMGMSLGSILSGGMGSGSSRTLNLRLTSMQPVAQQPESGEHFFLPAAKLGKSVPLLGAAPGGAPPPERRDPREAAALEKPKGRLLIFWGCHATAPKGQPFIIDFAKLPTAKMPPIAMPAGMGGRMGGADRSRAMQPGRDDNSAWWPNGKSRKEIKSGASLVGAHRITSAFAPEISFSLAQDFMAPLSITVDSAGSAIDLSWNNVASATGYAAFAIGGMDRAMAGSGEGGDLVIWTSAANRDFAGGSDWLPPAEVQREIAARNIMPPSQTQCAIPAEAKAAANGMMMGFLNGFGPEENFAFPPRPTDPGAVWNIEWTAKARYRTSGSFMVGVGGPMGARGSQPEPKPRKPRPCRGPMGIPIPGTSC